MHGRLDDLLLRPEALLDRPEMSVGNARLHPATRVLEGTDGRTILEPRVLQLLVALADAGGEVVPRATIEARCWGVPVSEDTLNQAIASLRRAARASGGFRIETIPRTGYRLVAEEAGSEEPPPSPRDKPDLSSRRRLLMAGGVTAIAGSAGLIAVFRPRADPRVAGLLQQGQAKLRQSARPATAEAAALFAEATNLAPDDPAAWGWRAVASCRMTDNAPPDRAESALADCERVLARAEALDPRDANAIAVRAMQPRVDDTLLTVEDRLVAAHTRAPLSPYLTEQLEAIAQAAGRTRLSFQWNDRGMAADPDVAGIWWKRALKYWILGDWRRSDLVIEQAMQRWPRHPVVWGNRIQILALTNRPEAALRLLRQPAIKASGMAPESHECLRAGALALSRRSAANTASARETYIAVSRSYSGIAPQAVMFLSMLGEIDTAYAFAEGYILHRGPFAGGSSAAEIGKVGNFAGSWRHTQWVFTPASAAFRADPRFPAFVRDIGLIDYWRARGAAPDAIHGVSKERLGL